MSLFDVAASVIGNCLSGGTQTAGQPSEMNTQSVLGAVMGALNNHPGGLGGVMDSLSRGGLGDAVASWIGNGPNAVVPPTQIQGALGSNVVNEIAGRLGVSPEMASSVLSQVLPHIVDHLTPTGQMPQGGISGAGGELLENILRGSFGSSMGAGR